MSPYLVISLSLMMRLISCTIKALTHTKDVSWPCRRQCLHVLRTFFADEGVIPVIGVVRVSCYGRASVPDYTEVELCASVRLVPHASKEKRPYPRTRDQIAQSDPSCEWSASHKEVMVWPKAAAIPDAAARLTNIAHRTAPGFQPWRRCCVQGVS